MKNKLKLIITFLIVAITHISFGQQHTVKDSITVFTDSVFNIIQEKHMHRNKKDWPEVKEEFLQKALTKTSFEEVLPLFNSIWSDLGDYHSGFIYKDQTITNPKNYTGEEFSPALYQRYLQGDFTFQCKVLDNQYGYIFMPPIQLPGKENMDSIAQSMYDKIIDVAKNNEIKGWIIDLRLNFGGNCWPMIASLYEFLGDGPVVGWEMNGEIQKVVLKDGVMSDWEDSLSIKRSTTKDLTKVKVALITSVFTGSSGEIVAIAFKGRENTIIIGETTAGLTSTNNTYEMPFGIYFNQAEGYDVDRFGNRYPVVKPDIRVEKGDNFKNLSEDQNIKNAIDFFNSVP